MTATQTAATEGTAAVHAAERIITQARDHQEESPLERAERIIASATRCVAHALLTPEEQEDFGLELREAEGALKRRNAVEAQRIAYAVNNEAYARVGQRIAEQKRERQIDYEEGNLVVFNRAQALVSFYTKKGVEVDFQAVYDCLVKSGEGAVRLYAENGYPVGLAIAESRRLGSTKPINTGEGKSRANRESEWRNRKMATSQAGPAKGPSGGGRNK